MSTNLTETWCADCRRQLTIDETRMQITWCHDLPGWRCESCYIRRCEAVRTGSREMLKHLRINIGEGACRLTLTGDYLTNDPAKVTCPACRATPQFSVAVATPEPTCQICDRRTGGVTACRRCGATRCQLHISNDGCCAELGRAVCRVTTPVVHRRDLYGQPLSPAVCGVVQDGGQLTDVVDEVMFWVYCEAAPPRRVVESTVVALDAPVAGQSFQVPLVWSAALKVEAARHAAWYQRVGATRSQGQPDRDHAAPITLDLYGGAVVTVEEQFSRFGQRCTLCGAWLRRKDC